MICNNINNINFRHDDSTYKNIFSYGVGFRIKSILGPLTFLWTKTNDQLTVFGKGNQKIKGGSIINASNDHRIAMSFASLGSITENSIEIRGASSIKTSFPNFIDLMNSIGLNIIALKD